MSARPLPISPARAVALAVTLCALGAGVGAIPARSATRLPARSPLTSRNLWATIDICSSTRHLDTLGIRGSMPGTGHTGVQMYMRFRVQFFSGTDHLWHYVTSRADSGYQGVGSGRFVKRESGWSFTFHPPTKVVYRLRGIVDFEWRHVRTVLLHGRMATGGGHRNVIGAQPRNYSAATCVLH